MEFMKSLTITANVASIISSFTIVYAGYVYLREVKRRHRKVSLSSAKSRDKNIIKIIRNPDLIDHIFVAREDFKNKSACAVLATRWHDINSKTRENNIRKGFNFILSNEAIRSYSNLGDPINNMELILNKFCLLMPGGNEFNNENMNVFDAWISLDKKRKFSFKFPLPKEFTSFDDIRFGNKTISSLGNEYIHEFFIPYLLLSIARRNDDLHSDDTFTLLSVLWEAGPS